MDPQFPFASRDELWRLQADMKSLFATHSEHTDRLLRLERRQEDDNRLKSVWGTSSPFPGILNGTPQQEPAYNPAAEAFKNFDQDQTSTILGSLHLDAEDEPRRGASRANSVRFDESALLNMHVAQGSRSSSDFFPMRTGSGLGSHPMTERSSSHKSEGRQSSTGQSVHSTRLNSLGYEANRPSMPIANSSGPPPGLFILGPLPSIIRCWLDTDFSTGSLLYAAVCTGSCRSVISSKMATQLGLNGQTDGQEGDLKVKIQVYLPEATIQQRSYSRSNSPIPQLPSLAVEFFVLPMSDVAENTIQVFLGSDILRARSADLLFSQDRLSLLDDDRNTLMVPLVRPENPLIFQNLLTISRPIQGYNVGIDHRVGDSPGSVKNLQRDAQRPESKKGKLHQMSHSPIQAPPGQDSMYTDRRSDLGDKENVQSKSQDFLDDNAVSESFTDGTTPDTPSKPENGNIWGSWRRDSAQNSRPDSTFSSVASSSGYQRPGRGRGMKVLKPTRSSTSSRSFSSVQAPTSIDVTTTQPSEVERNSRASELPRSTAGRSMSTEIKAPLQLVTNNGRSTNPVGGASAFGWLNSSQKQASTAIE